jgi:hypothetical protein
MICHPVLILEARGQPVYQIQRRLINTLVCNFSKFFFFTYILMTNFEAQGH